jgi:hypothetical protein
MFVDEIADLSRELKQHGESRLCVRRFVLYFASRLLFLYSASQKMHIVINIRIPAQTVELGKYERNRPQGDMMP